METVLYRECADEGSIRKQTKWGRGDDDDDGETAAAVAVNSREVKKLLVVVVFLILGVCWQVPQSAALSNGYIRIVLIMDH